MTVPFNISFYGEVSLGSLLENQGRQHLRCNLDEAMSSLTQEGRITSGTDMELEAYSVTIHAGHDSVYQALKVASHKARQAGYAVVIFSPEELEGVDPRLLQNRLVELGNEAISDLKEAP